MKLLIFIFGFGLSAQALEPQNPIALCDRFITPLEKTHCEEQIKKMEPDWYLSSLCAKQIEDAAFYRCLSLSKSMQVSIKKLEACDQTESTDEGRIQCVQAAKANNSSEAYQPVPEKFRAEKAGRMRVSLDRR